jgi:hypothetical protein
MVKSRATVCEICGLKSGSAIERHHIIPRTDPRSTNKASNIASICGSCHNEVHAGTKVIEGRFLTTSGNNLFWHNIGELPKIREGVILLDSGLADIRW